MIPPIGSEVTMKDGLVGYIIGHYDTEPIMWAIRVSVMERDIDTYTDEDGNVRKMEEPIT